MDSSSIRLPGGDTHQTVHTTQPSLTEAQPRTFPDSQHAWARTPAACPERCDEQCWMVLADDSGLADQIILQLLGAQKRVINVVPGSAYKRLSLGRYTVRPSRTEDYARLAKTVLRKEGRPTRVIHLWSIRRPADAAAADEKIELGLCSVTRLVRELLNHGLECTDIALVSNAPQPGDDGIGHSVREGLLQFPSILAQTFPKLVFRSIDVDTSTQSLGQIAIQVINEHATTFTDAVVAYRGEERWIQTAECVDAGAPPQQKSARTAMRIVPQRPRPAEGVEYMLERWWSELLASPNISSDDDFFNLGGDSITAVQLFARIKNTYGLELGLSTIFEARTIRNLAALIRQSTESAPKPRTSPSLVAIQPKGSQPRIHIISGLGGNVIKFQKLAYYLGEDQPLFGLLPRGLDGREPYFTRVEDMAAYYADAIVQSQPAGPYRLMGYSFGGLVAFETARQIVARGGEISFVGLLDTAEPQYLDRLQKKLPSWRRYRAYKEYLEMVVSEGGFERLKNHFATRISSLTFRIYRVLGRPVPQDLARIEYVNLLAGTEYHPKQYFGKLTLFRSTARDGSEGMDSDLGWRGLSSEIEVVDLPSNHFNILQEPNVRLLAEKLKTAISRDLATSTAVAVPRS